MIPKVVKKVRYSDLRHVDGGSFISTKLLKKLNLKLTERQLFYIRHALELGFKQMPQDDRETYDGILKMFNRK